MRIANTPSGESSRFGTVPLAARSAGRVRGFSLIELVVVMLIIGLLAAIALPRYGSAVAHYRADMAGQRLVADLRLAQANARATSQSQTVSFILSPAGYQMPGIASLDRRSSSYSVDMSSDPYSVTYVSVAFGGSTQLTFDRYGMPGAGGSVVIQSAQFQTTVTVDASSGQINIQ